MCLLAVQQHAGQDQNDFRLQTLRNDWLLGWSAYDGRRRRSGARAGVHPRAHAAADEYRQTRATTPDKGLATQFFVAGNECLGLQRRL